MEPMPLRESEEARLPAGGGGGEDEPPRRKQPATVLGRGQVEAEARGRLQARHRRRRPGR